MLYKMADWRPCGLFQGGNGTNAAYCRISEYQIPDDHAFQLYQCRKEKKEKPVMIKLAGLSDEQVTEISPGSRYWSSEMNIRDRDSCGR